MPRLSRATREADRIRREAPFREVHSSQIRLARVKGLKECTFAHNQSGELVLLVRVVDEGTPFSIEEGDGYFRDTYVAGQYASVRSPILAGYPIRVSGEWYRVMKWYSAEELTLLD